MSRDRWTLDLIVEDVREVAAELGIPASSLSRNRYRTHGEGRATSKPIGKHGGWGLIQALAVSASLPLTPVPSGHLVKGASTLLGPNGEVKAQWIKTRENEAKREEALREMLEQLPKTIPVREGCIKPPAASDDDLLAVYPMGDPHIGMLAWAEESGEDYDLGIARRIMEGAINELVTHEPRASRALICNLGDFFHSDSQANRTARSGHQLDVDGRWSKVLRVGLDIMIHTIDRALSAHREVRVINEIGNHDDHSAVFLSVALDAHYRNEPRVSIDTSPARFHYHRFGDNFIGVTHGDNAKPAKLGQIMATDRRKDWGEATHCFWYCGHIHHTNRIEVPGCVIESFRTLASKDAYAMNGGYRAGRDMNRILLHRRHGEISRSIVSADYLRSMWQEAA